MNERGALHAYGNFRFERPLVGTALLLSVAGFWNLYLGPHASTTPYHHLHVLTNFVWLALLLVQIASIRNGRPGRHRQVGLLVLLAAPLLVASTTLLRPCKQTATRALPRRNSSSGHANARCAVAPSPTTGAGATQGGPRRLASGS